MEMNAKDIEDTLGSVKGVNEKIILKLENVQFNRGRFPVYFGNIGEMIAREMLLKDGFEVWLFRPYFPSSPPLSGKEVLGSNIIYDLNCLQQVRKSVAGRDTELHISLEECKRRAKALEDFFGSTLENFVQYAKRIGLTEVGRSAHQYAPDMAAKKDGRIYIVEVKVNTGALYLKGEKLQALKLAREYGFIPMLITLNIDMKVTNLIAREL